MKKLTTLFLLCITVHALAADSLNVSLNTRVFRKGETLDFTATVPGFEALGLQRATLNVWIEDLQKHKRWKYRYPLINGEVSASLTISDKIPDGRYAVNFLVQQGFFKVTGEILDHYRKDTSLVSMMILKDKKESFTDKASVSKTGRFHLKSTLFVDSAFFVFAPDAKVNRNYFSIFIETPLDSAFVPVIARTRFITVGDVSRLTPRQRDSSRYSFLFEEQDSSLLPGVIVTTKFKTKVEQFDDEYSHALFQNPEAMMFDGLGSSEMTHFATIQQYLQSKVPGMTLGQNGSLTWRNGAVQLYVDEFPYQFTNLSFLSPADVAMIKVFRPTLHAGGNFNTAGGTVAVYTKRGAYATGNTRHSFVVRGYTKFESVWN